MARTFIGCFDIAAFLAGQSEMGDGVFGWIVALYESQRDLPHRLYNARAGEVLVTEHPTALEWVRVTDFTKPRQTYFHPGIAEVFLAGYAMQRGDHRAIELPHRFLQLNIAGTSAEFDDPESVQICKFGWGAAAMQIADPSCDYRDQLLRMSRWFIEHQGAGGSSSPSLFVKPRAKIA